MVYGKQFERGNVGYPGIRAGQSACLGGGPLVRMAVAMGVVLLACSSVLGEFMVQPIIIKRQVQPGKRVPLEFAIENLSRDAMEIVKLRLVDLTQDANGIWAEVAPGSPLGGGQKSCRDWVHCTVESVQLDPWQRMPVPLLVTVPPGKRGYYFAALIAETEPRAPDGEANAMFSIQYLVPIILECQSTPVPARISLTDVKLHYRAPTVREPSAAVIATLDIVNNGGSYSRLQGQVRIWQHTRGYWHKIADVTLPDTGIIPGVTLNLKQDMGMLLPNGRYKVEGYLYVDGRRGNAINNIIDFKGDPRIVSARTDVLIDVDKEELLIDVMPRATRAGSLLVGNGSEETVDVRAEVILPEHMVHAQSARGVKGDDLSCADWLTVGPSQFTLTRYARRSVNVLVRTPETATAYSHYYATLRLYATYPDGSSGGMKEVNICLKNSKEPDKHEIDKGTFTLASSSSSRSRYFATAIFTNGGVTHVVPRCKAVLTTTTADGGIWKQFLMSSEAYRQTGIFLPFESRSFTGILDVADVAPGTYRLTAILEYPGGNIQSQIMIKVSDQGGQRVAEIIDSSQAPDGKGTVIIQL